MFTLKQHICYPGITDNPDNPNEDAIGYGKDYCFAMDGASCLSGVEIMDRGSDATWMVEQVAAALCQRLDAGDDRPTKEILSDILMPLRAQYYTALAEKGIEKPDDSPSAGFAMFRVRKGKLEFFGLGDCVGVAALPNGEEFCKLDPDLPNLDNQVLERMMQLHLDRGIPVLQAKKECRQQLLENRKMRNHPEGYWVLDLDTPETLDNAFQYTWDLTEPVAVAAFSDGFSQLADVFGVYDSYFDLFTAMQTTDLEKMWLD